MLILAMAVSLAWASNGDSAQRSACQVRAACHGVQAYSSAGGAIARRNGPRAGSQPSSPGSVERWDGTIEDVAPTCGGARRVRCHGSPGEGACADAAACTMIAGSSNDLRWLQTHFVLRTTRLKPRRCCAIASNSSRKSDTNFSMPSRSPATPKSTTSKRCRSCTAESVGAADAPRPTNRLLPFKRANGCSLKCANKALSIALNNLHRHDIDNLWLADPPRVLLQRYLTICALYQDFPRFPLLGMR